MINHNNTSKHLNQPPGYTSSIYETNIGSYEVHHLLIILKHNLIILRITLLKRCLRENMRFSAGTIVIIINWNTRDAVKNFMDILDRLIPYVDLSNLYLSLNFNVISTLVRGVKRHIVIPPSAIIIKLINDTIKEIEDITKSGNGVKVIRLSDDSWIDCKPLIRGGIELSQDITLSDEYSLLASFISKVNELFKDTKCYLLGLKFIESFNEYLSRYLKQPNILAPVNNVGHHYLVNSEKCHDAVPLWPSHPVIYGIDFSKLLNSVECLIYNAPQDNRFRLLSKPLVITDKGEAILEIPYSKSIVFMSNLITPGLLLKALLYTC